MIKRLSIIFGICFFLFGCKYSSKQSTEENNYIDTILYRTGKIKCIAEFRNGKKHGWQYEYTPDGKLSAKAEYKNGIASGVNCSYFENGKIESSGKWLNGKVFGDVLWYYQNGNVEQYSCYDFEGHARYREKYANDGTLISRDGVLVGQLLNDSDFDSLYINKFFYTHICVANPPNTKIQVRLIQYNNIQRILQDTMLTPIENLVTLKKTFSRSGLYRQLVIGSLYDHNNKLLQQDTLVTIFNIK